MNQQVEIGDLVKDRVTGFTGIVTVMSKFLAGCDRCSVQPIELEKGSTRPSEGFDVLQLEILEKQKVVIEPRIIETKKGSRKTETGGPPVYPIPEPPRVSR